MKRIKLVTVLIISVLALFTLTSCEPPEIHTSTSGSFSEVERGSFSGGEGHYVIMRHEETGVYYIATCFMDSEGYRFDGGLTALLNADGTPYTGK